MSKRLDFVLLKCLRCGSIYSMSCEDVYFKRREPWCIICGGKDIEELHDVEHDLEFGNGKSASDSH